MLFLYVSSNKRDNKTFKSLYIGSNSVKNALNRAKEYFEKNKIKGKPKLVIKYD